MTVDLKKLRECLAKVPGELCVRQCLDGVHARKFVLICREHREILGPRQLGYPHVPDELLEAYAELLVLAVNALPELLDALEAKVVAPPAPELLASMATRLRHDFGLLPDYEQKAMLVEMEQVWEEVVGLGFYRPAHAAPGAKEPKAEG